MSEFKYIDKVGLELEGLWFKRQEKELVRDASLEWGQFTKGQQLSREGKLNTDYINYHMGEKTSKPLDDWDRVAKYLTENWPDETSKKSAFHIHVSLKDINLYSALMPREFYDFFLIEMEKWGKNYPCTNQMFWDRLEDKNKYARRQFRPERQITQKTKEHNDENRYTHLNYCYGVFQTVECRLFPTFMDYRTAISATKALIDCIDAYLDKNPTGNIAKAETIIDDIADIPIDYDRKAKKIRNFNYFILKDKMLKRIVEKGNEEEEDTKKPVNVNVLGGILVDEPVPFIPRPRRDNF